MNAQVQETLDKRVKEVMTEKVKELDAIDANIARQEKNGEWRVARDLAARRFLVQTSIVKVIKRWIQAPNLATMVKAVEAPISESTQTDAKTSGYYEPLYEAMCRERDVWKIRTSELLDLLLCDHCKLEKQEVYHTGSNEEIIDWLPWHFNGKCYKVRSRFEQGYF